MNRLLPTCAALIVTYNSDTTISACLSSLASQEGFTPGENLHIFVLDNASSDDTKDRVKEFTEAGVHLNALEENTGFAAGNNILLKTAFAHKSSPEYALLLNPDAALNKDALKNLVQALEADPRAGSAAPKLLRADDSMQAVVPSVIDSTGMFVVPSIRHFDRGSQEHDLGHYNAEQYVFGATGAAMLLRRSFVLDTVIGQADSSLGISLFDEAFFAYREDADLAWRAAWLGWKCRYVPHAVGVHLRRVLPERRKSLPASINRLGVQNRFLLLANNFSWRANFHCILPGLYRNLLVLAAVLLLERSSIAGLKSALAKLPRARARRAELFRRCRVPAHDVAKWFRTPPYTEPALTLRGSRSKISKLAIVIVNFNSGSLLGSCLHSVEQALKTRPDDVTVKVFIVDNASSDQSVEEAQKALLGNEQIEFISLKKNIGFGSAINSGRTAFPEAEALLVLNPDVEINSSALIKLLDALEQHDTIAAAAPLLENHDARTKDDLQYHYSFRRFPTLGSTLAELYFLHRLWPKNPWSSFHHQQRDSFIKNYALGLKPGEMLPFDDPEKPLIVEQPAAAALMLRTKEFDYLGGFDTGFWPAWFEDVDYCKRLAAKGKYCAVLSSARVSHQGGYSTEKISKSDFAAAWYANCLRYWSRHGKKAEYVILSVLVRPALLIRAAAALLRHALLLAKGSQERQWLDAAKTLLLLVLNPRSSKQAKHNIQQAASSSKRYLRKLKQAASGSTGSTGSTGGTNTPSASDEMTSQLMLPTQGLVEDEERNIQDESEWKRVFEEQLQGEGVVIEAPNGAFGADTAVKIESLANDSLDYLVAVNRLEYEPSPIAALEAWCRVLKPGGLLHLVVQDKRFGEDSKRVRTTLEHMILDYQRPSKSRDFEHFLEYAKHNRGIACEHALEEARRLEAGQHPVNSHVLLPKDTAALLLWFSENIQKLDVLEGPVKHQDNGKSHLLLKLPQLH